MSDDFDYEDLSMRWWQYMETNDSKYQPKGVVFLPGMTGGHTKHNISAKVGDRLFFSAAKFFGPAAKDDIDDKVTFEVAFGDLPLKYLGRIKTRKTFKSLVEGANSVSDGHWYISEPLMPGKYQGTTHGRVPRGNFSEKTDYDITVK